MIGRVGSSWAPSTSTSARCTWTLAPQRRGDVPGPRRSRPARPSRDPAIDVHGQWLSTSSGPYAPCRREPRGVPLPAAVRAGVRAAAASVGRHWPPAPLLCRRPRGHDRAPAPRPVRLLARPFRTLRHASLPSRAPQAALAGARLAPHLPPRLPVPRRASPSSTPRSPAPGDATVASAFAPPPPVPPCVPSRPRRTPGEMSACSSGVERVTRRDPGCGGPVGVHAPRRIAARRRPRVRTPGGVLPSGATANRP